MPAAHAMTRKLESIFDLTAEERRAVEDLPVRIRDVKAGEALVREGDRPTHCCLIMAGLACRSKLVDDEGGRQIMSFHISGDIPDLQGLHLDLMDHDLGMLQAGKVGFFSHDDVKAMNGQHPRIAAALWRNRRN
jgi:CRP-like cAMP-binding protein